MKTSIMTFLLCIFSIFSFAQETPDHVVSSRNRIVSPHRIEVTFDKTVHILFPAAVRYVDLGSTNLIAGKVTGTENIVRVKAAVRDFQGETNFSVITADGCFYSFDVTYADEPARLSIEMEDLLIRNTPNVSANGRVSVKLQELGGETPALVDRIMYDIYQKNVRDLKHIGSKKFGILTMLRGIYVHNDLLYFHTLLRNYSDLSFDIDYIRFVVRDKKIAKRTAVQESVIEPVRTFNRTVTVDGKATVRSVFVLPKVTIPDDKVLEVEIYERDGGRHQSYRIENTDLVTAKPIDKLKFR